MKCSWNIVCNVSDSIGFLKSEVLVMGTNFSLLHSVFLFNQMLKSTSVTNWKKAGEGKPVVDAPKKPY